MKGVDHPINPVQNLLAGLLQHSNPLLGSTELGGKLVTLGFEGADARCRSGGRGAGVLSRCVSGHIALECFTLLHLASRRWGALYPSRRLGSTLLSGRSLTVGHHLIPDRRPMVKPEPRTIDAR